MSVELPAQKPTRLQTLRAALDAGRLASVQGLLQSLLPAEIGHLLEALPPAERELVWELVDREEEGEILLEVNDEVRERLIRDMDLEELIEATEDMEVDDLADLLGDLPEAITTELLKAMSLQDRQRLEAVLQYDEDSAGGLMNTDTITVRPDVSLDVVLRYLRLHGKVPEGTDSLFVVNRFGKLLGSLPLTRLLTEDPTEVVNRMMDTELPAIGADTPTNEVALLFEQRDLVSAPVVDEAGCLLGRITIDDVVDVIRDEAEHSLMSMAGLDEEEDMFAPVFDSARRRAIWLGVNLATAFLAARVVGLFEATIEQVVALAVLMPVVASMGGIAGSQTLTLMIRGIALGQVERSNARWMLFKELSVGALNSLLWAVVVGLVTLWWFGSWRIGAVIAAALTINLLAGALAGVAVPLVLKRMDIDPALAGGVVLTTITDVVGFVAFLGLGTVFLLGVI